MSQFGVPRRRTLANWFLGLAGLLLVCGETVLKPFLGRGVGFILYWLACFIFTGLALLMGMLDYFALRRLARDQHRKLIRDATTGVTNEPPENSKSG